MRSLLERLVAGINLPTMVAAALLVLAVIAAIRIGKTLLMAGMIGAVAGGVSLGQGQAPGRAGTHAAIGFGVAMVTLLLARMARGVLMWAIITAAGIIGLVLANLGS